MAFANIESNEKLDVFDIAVVETDEFNSNELYKEAFKELSDSNNDNQLFNIKYVTEEEGKKLLEDKEIVGYVVINDTSKVVVNSSDVNETVLKYAVDEITEQEHIINNLVTKQMENINPTQMQSIDYEKIYKNAMNVIENSNGNIKDISNSNLSYTMIEFYTLIAMACLYGGTISMSAINNTLANMTSKGKRISVSATSRVKVILSSALASYVVQIIGLALLFAYTIFALKVDFGDNLPLIVLLALVGSFAGLAMGILVAAIVKKNENIKVSILISITMLGCFLSGMMGITMKYVVDTNVPIVNKLNPANMITDGFYALYYYNTLDRYYFNIYSLLIFSGILILISIICLRGQKYDSL